MGAYAIMGIVWAAVIIWVGLVIFTNRKVHPKALFLLFFAELWERFSYYGMRALLVLYMIDEMVLTDKTVDGVLVTDTMTGLGYDQKMAYAIYAAYGAMVYATPVIGGLLAEKVLGYRKAILWGGILMALGHFAMAFEYEVVFYIALALLILGNGFFKPNISSFVGTFYEKDDPRRDGGFTLFYMGINVGAVLTPLTCGAIGEIEGWHYGFGLAGIGMLIGLGVFYWGLQTGVFGEKGHAPKEQGVNLEKGGKNANKATLGMFSRDSVLVYLGTFAAIPLVYLLLNHSDILDYILLGISGGMILYLLVYALQQEKIQREKILVIIVLFFFTALFWTFFELAGSAINVFTKTNVDRTVFGNELPTSFFQSVNPGFIILLAPVFTWMWAKLAKAKAEPNAPLKFAIGVLLLGAGFMVLGWSEGFAEAGMVPVIFLILGYLLHTIGELCLSPVGLSLVTKLSPAALVGFVMGIWFLSSSVAHNVGKFIATETASDNLSAVDSLPLYTGVFYNVGLFALGASVLLFALSPILKKWMHGVK